MVLILLSTVPLSGTPSSFSPCSPCSNPFSASFAAFLKPVFSEEDFPEPASSQTASTAAIPSTGTPASKPQFTYPWLKPSPLRTPHNARTVKALPPLPDTPPSPDDSFRRESEPLLTVNGTARRRPGLMQTFSSRGSPSTSRRSRYEVVPTVSIDTSVVAEDASNSAVAASNLTTPPSAPRVEEKRSTSPKPVEQASTTPAATAPSKKSAKTGGEAYNFLDFSIALSGVDLDISTFTPSLLASSAPRTDYFSTPTVSSSTDSTGMDLTPQSASTPPTSVSTPQIRTQEVETDQNPLTLLLPATTYSPFEDAAKKEPTPQPQPSLASTLGAGLGLAVFNSGGRSRAASASAAGIGENSTVPISLPIMAPVEVDAEESMVVPLAIEVAVGGVVGAANAASAASGNSNTTVNNKLISRRKIGLGLPASPSPSQGSLASASTSTPTLIPAPLSDIGLERRMSVVSVGSVTSNAVGASSGVGGAARKDGDSSNKLAVTGKRWPGQTTRRSSLHGGRTTSRGDVGFLPRVVEA